MVQFANWTNLSESTFLLNPTNELADYKLRIFTPSSELAFAGHPTLGSCYAWLNRGGVPKNKDIIIQECGVGLIKIRRNGERLSFLAPKLLKTGPLDQTTLNTISKGIGISVENIAHHQWVDNGAGWCAVMLKTASQVLAIKPNVEYLKTLKLGVIGPHPTDHEHDFEVRAFVIPFGIHEDPVTGSLNAGIATWLINSGLSKDSYSVSQGAALGRKGKIYIEAINNEIWVGGEVVNCIEGEVRL
jgi:PhzF family phenazine biosynthesis protein